MGREIYFLEEKIEGIFFLRKKWFLKLLLNIS